MRLLATVVTLVAVVVVAGAAIPQIMVMAVPG
jgi:hypothetical protein